MQRPTLESVAWFVGLGLVAFFPILFLGQCYDANDLLYFFTPWRLYLRECLSQGILPLWGPNFFCGQPFLADPQIQILYPPTWLTLIPSIPTGLNLYIVLHWFIAVFGMRHWLRSLDLSEGAARIGALLLGFSGFFWWEIIHPPVLGAFAWLPWWFAALEKTLQKPQLRSGWFLGFAFAMLFLSGSFQVTLGAGYGGFFYLLIRFWEQHRQGAPFRFPIRTIVLVFAAFLAGAALIGPQVIATQRFSSLSNRENAGKDYLHFNAYWSLQPSTLGQYFLPRFSVPPGQTLENAIQVVTGDGGQKAASDNIGNDFLANFGFMGIWLPFLCLFAFQERRKYLAWGLLSLGGLSILVSLGRHFFLHELLCNIAPGFSLLRASFRFQYLYVLPAAALAAMGYQAFTREGVPAAQVRFRRTAALAYGVLLLLIALAEPGQCWREILALLLGTVGFILLHRPGLVRWGRFLVGAALIGPLLLSGWGDFAVHPSSNLELRQNVPWLEAVPPDPEGRRVFLDPNLPYVLKTGDTSTSVPFPHNAAFACGLRIMDGYNPLNLRNFTEVQTLPFPALSKLTALDRLVLSRDPVELPGYHRINQGPLVLMQADQPRPTAYAPSHWQVVEDAPMRLRLLADSSFDPYQTSILDQPMREGALPDFHSPPSFRASLLEDRSNDQTWKVDASEALVAIFTETYYPGWIAEIDGKSLPVMEANHAFRAVSIPSGSHQLTFHFRPVERGWLLPFGIAWVLIALVLWMKARQIESSGPSKAK